MRETTPAIRCFVAMAVGRTDTDRIYDKHILPTLRAAGIKAIFMGRLEHNDDIDKRIILEIEKCDFAIADLTYARPSVYFEAGYAQGKVRPVIYTAQADHLRGRHDDEFGNFRVHFDLLMRNIIAWSSPKDSSFSRRLSKRIRKVIAPMLQQRQAAERSKAEELEFQRLPLVSRLDVVSNIFGNVMKRCGYISLMVGEASNPWVGRDPDRFTLDVGVVSAEASFTQKAIDNHADGILELLRSRLEKIDDQSDLYHWQNRWQGHRPPKPAETKDVTKVVARLVLCSLQKIPRGRLTAALSFYTANETGQVFKWQGDLTTTIFSKKHLASFSSGKSLPASVSVYVVDPIKSVPDATRKAKQLKLAIQDEH